MVLVNNNIQNINLNKKALISFKKNEDNKTQEVKKVPNTTEIVLGVTAIAALGVATFALISSHKNKKAYEKLLDEKISKKPDEKSSEIIENKIVKILNEKSDEIIENKVVKTLNEKSTKIIDNKVTQSVTKELDNKFVKEWTTFKESYIKNVPEFAKMIEDWDLAFQQWGKNQQKINESFQEALEYLYDKMDKRYIMPPVHFSFENLPPLKPRTKTYFPNLFIKN